MTTAPLVRTADRAASESELAPLWKPGVFGVALGLVALELIVSARYGFHRDELYFMACARHLAWGYVDQPPFVPAVAWLATHTLGNSPTALRVLPALTAGATVVLAALMARELGGRRYAQLLAALAAATSPEVVATFHLLSTAAFDMFFWAAISLLVLRLLRTGDARLWLAIGTVSGIGLLNKLNVLFLLVAVVIGMLLGGRRRSLTSPWLAVGGAIALVVWSPNILWNAHHHWAAIAMLHSLHTENSTIGASIGFVPSQLVVVGPVLVVFWIAGLRHLLRSTFARSLGIAFVVLLVLFTLSGAKSYYLAGAYFALFAAGGVWAEARLDRRVPATSVRAWVLLMTVGLLVALPISLPVLPQRTLPSGAWEGAINKDLSATIGWRGFVGQVAGVARGLPSAQRSDVVLFTGDYGAAGAIDEWGASYGLPHAISGHNNYWWWGPAGARDGATTIAVNMPRSYLRTIFSDVTPAGVVTTPHNAWTEERGDPIFVCRGQRVPWAEAWPDARDYG